MEADRELYKKFRETLDNYKDHPLSGAEVSQIVDGKANVFKYTDLARFKTIDDVLKPSGAAIILIEQKPGYGHWVAMTCSPVDGSLMFFDPYGDFVDTEIDLIPEPWRTESGQSNKYLSKLLLESDRELNYNEFQFQKLDKRVKSCGRWSCLFVILNHYGMDLYTFKKFFLNVYSDDLATIFTS